MRIKKVHLIKHKRFKDLTIDLTEKPARVVVLVGKNGCGKSSIFDAFLYEQNSFDRIGKNSSFGKEYYALNDDNEYNYKNIEIEFENMKFETMLKEKQAIGKGKTIFSFRSPFRFNGNLNVKKLESVGDIKNNLEGASSTNDIDQRIEENYKRLQAKYQDNLVLYEKTKTPFDIKEGIIGELNTYIQDCLDLQISDMGNILKGNGTLYFSKKDNEKSFEYKVLSSGEKEVVDLILDIYLRRDEYNDTIYLFDEPELHINTGKTIERYN